MSENYFKILEVGKNVRTFLLRRDTKMSENETRKRINVRKCLGKCQKMFWKMSENVSYPLNWDLTSLKQVDLTLIGKFPGHELDRFLENSSISQFYNIWA